MRPNQCYNASEKLHEEETSMSKNLYKQTWNYFIFYALSSSLPSLPLLYPFSFPFTRYSGGGYLHAPPRPPPLTELNPYLSTKVRSGTNAATPSTIPSNTRSGTRSLTSIVHSRAADHLSADEARQISDANGPILLLTVPPSVGYEQNPLSVYYCYDVEGSTTRLKKCIAEVTNTPWGESASFIFNPYSDLVAKTLHVSPFMDMLGSWNIKAIDPILGENLTISISVHHPEHGNYFTASLKAKKLCSSSQLDHAVFFWLMPHKVAVWIYWHWHALKLWWKNVHFVQHPRYTIPTYREEAIIRDRKLQYCGLSDDNRHLHQRGSE